MKPRLIVALTLILLILGPACTEQAATPVDDFVEGVEQEGPPLDSATLAGKADEFGGEIPAHGPLPSDAELNGPLEALFAPDDPNRTLELALIERVVAARLGDPLDYEEGNNPYRISYAVYNLRNPEITAALVDAAHNGVDVQVLIDSAQLDPARTWNQTDEILQQEGFEFAPSHRDLTAAERVTADLIGIDRSGLMHLKMRLFETPMEASLLTGSQNPGDNAMLNEETLHLINDPVIVERYRIAYESVLENRRIPNVWDETASINALFTPAQSGPRAVERLFDWIAAEEEQILIMVFSLRDIRAPGHDRSLVELLADKVASGVPVYVITDRKQSDGITASGERITRDDPTDDRLRAVGVHVYEAINHRTEYTAMHHKVVVLGRSHIRVVTDAANWTFSGLGSDTRRARNVESVLFIDSHQLDQNRTGRRYMAQWLRVLERYASQTPDEPTYLGVVSELTGASDWPTEPVTFVAEGAQTAWGETIHAVGSLPELGVWSADATQASLTTDESIYPMWHSEVSVPMPLAVPFEWKWVASDGSETRWETGANRIDTARPLALQPGPVELRAAWR